MIDGLVVLAAIVAVMGLIAFISPLIRALWDLPNKKRH